MTDPNTSRRIDNMKSIETPVFRVEEYSASPVPFTKSDTEGAEHKLLETLEALPPGAILLVEFEGVRISSEAARQLLRRALLRVTTGELTDRFLVLGDLGDSQYNVDIMLSGENLTAIERTADEGPQLRGQVDPAVRATYDYMLGVETTTANGVLDALKLTNISTATNRLANLARLGLARRVEQRPVPGGGREFVYQVIK